MNAKTAYDSIIQKIEEGASDCEQNLDDLMFSIVRHSMMSSQDLIALIRFMTGNTLLGYIKERKLMAAYRYLIETDKPKIMHAVELAGFDNQSSFTKKFSASFGMPPKEASKVKDVSLLTTPSTWDAISCESATSSQEEVVEAQMDGNTRFGISQEQYEIAMEAHELENLYDLPKKYGYLAYDLYEHLGMTLKEVFSFANSLHEYIEDEIIINNDDPDPDFDEDRKLWETAHSEYFHHCFFKCGISVSTAEWIYLCNNLWEEDIMRIDPAALKAYGGTDPDVISLGVFMELFSKYPNILDDYKHTDNLDDVTFSEFSLYYSFFMDSIRSCNPSFSEDPEVYEKYMENLFYYDLPKESALERAIEWGSFSEQIDTLDLEDSIDDPFDETESAIESLAAEQEAWNDVRIDIELDPDNPYYDYEDLTGDDPFDF